MEDSSQCSKMFSQKRMLYSPFKQFYILEPLPQWAQFSFYLCRKGDPGFLSEGKLRYWFQLVTSNHNSPKPLFLNHETSDVTVLYKQVPTTLIFPFK